MKIFIKRWPVEAEIALEEDTDRLSVIRTRAKQEGGRALLFLRNLQQVDLQSIP
jgi:hypothetical protein